MDMNNTGQVRSYREDIEAALLVDLSRTGDVFRAARGDDNKTARSIADELGIGTPGPVYSALKSIETLIEGRRLAGGPTYASQKAGMLREFSRRHANILSETTKQRLLELSIEHDKIAKDEEAIARENEEIERALETDESQDVPGIYVYTYPHYRRFPVLRSEEDFTGDRTYLKIGLATRSVARRIREQTVTALPEPPLLLRTYSKDDADLGQMERRIHNHLNAADHNQNRQRGSGTEWFLTHLKLIDSTANLLGLEVRYEHQEEAAEE